MQQKLSSGSVPWAYVGCSQGTVRRCQNSRPWSACSILMAILYSGKTLLGFTKTKTLERGFLVLRGRWLWTQKLLWGKLPSVVPTEMLMVGTTSRPVLQGSQHRWHHGKHHHSTAKSLPNVVQGLGSRENAALAACTSMGQNNFKPASLMTAGEAECNSLKWREVLGHHFPVMPQWWIKRRPPPLWVLGGRA